MLASLLAWYWMNVWFRVSFGVDGEDGMICGARANCSVWSLGGYFGLWARWAKGSSFPGHFRAVGVLSRCQGRAFF